jgi:hypothetical protein
MKSRHSHNLFLVMAICVMLFVGALYIYMYHVVDKAVIAALQARDTVKLETLNTNQQKEVARIYEETSVERARLNEFFIPKDNVVSFIEALESMGTTTGSRIHIASIASDNLDAALPGATGNVRVNLVVSGSWSSVLRTLQLAELLPYKSSIQNVKLDVSVQSGAKEKDPVKRTWQMVFDLSAVIVAPPKIK